MFLYALSLIFPEPLMKNETTNMKQSELLTNESKSKHKGP